MRVPILFMVLTVLAMLLGGVVVRGEEVASPDMPSGSAAEAQSDQEMAATLLDGVVIMEREADEEIRRSDEEQKSIPSDEDPELDGVVAPEWEEAFVREVEGRVDLDNLWRDPPEGATMLWRLTVAILRSRTVPAGKDRPREVVWQQCGQEVPHEEVVRRAAEWAFIFLASMEDVERKTQAHMPIWGVFASHANEGGFDPCALDFPTRKWASEHEAMRLIEQTWNGRTVKLKRPVKLVEKFQLSYDRETVWKILQDSYYPYSRTTMPNGREVRVAGKSDLGPWQIRTVVKKLTRHRFDQQTSMVPGIYIGVREMARRAVSFSYRFRVAEAHPRPWMLWPGWNPYAPKALLYDSKVTSVARWLGARRDEIEQGFLILDTKGKKNRYRFERGHAKRGST